MANNKAAGFRQPLNFEFADAICYNKSEYILIFFNKETSPGGGYLTTNEKVKKKEVAFIKTLAANLIDMAIILAASTVILLLGDFLMIKTIGYFVADLISMLLLLIIINTVIYNSLFQSSKNCATIGQKIAKLRVTNKTANGEMKVEKR